MRIALAFWTLALVGALLSGCSVPRREPVTRTETHEISPDGRARVTITVREKSAYNLSLGDYVLAVDRRLSAGRVVRTAPGAGPVDQPFERRTSAGRKDLIIHLDKPWVPGARLDVRVDGTMPVARKEADIWEYRYTLPAREVTNYSATLLLPAESEVLSIIPKPVREARDVLDGFDRYAWEGHLAAKEKVELRAIFKLKQKQAL